MAKFDALFGAAVDSSRSELFAVNPKQSYVSDEWIKADPDFWKPKPASDSMASTQKQRQTRIRSDHHARHLRSGFGIAGAASLLSRRTFAGIRLPCNASSAHSVNHSIAVSRSGVDIHIIQSAVLRHLTIVQARKSFYMTIFIPTPLRAFAGGQDAVEINAATIAEALDGLTQAHPDLRKHLFTGEGKLRAFVNLYLNDEDVRYLPAKESTTVTAADTLSIIPSIAGGC